VEKGIVEQKTFTSKYVHGLLAWCDSIRPSPHTYLHLASSEWWRWTGGRGIL